MSVWGREWLSERMLVEEGVGRKVSVVVVVLKEGVGGMVVLFGSSTGDSLAS